MKLVSSIALLLDVVFSRTTGNIKNPFQQQNSCTVSRI